MTTLTLVGEKTSRIWHVYRPKDGDPVSARGRCGVALHTVEYVEDVDARVVSHAGRRVCANCLTQLERDRSTLAVADAAAPARRAPKLDKPVTASGLRAAVERAEAAFKSQPSRARVELTPELEQRAFVLGKAISADLWRLRKVVKPDVDAQELVDRMVTRIEERVAERNEIRLSGENVSRRL